MFKQLITFCTGIALSTVATLAIDINGVYGGSSNGQNIVVKLASDSDGTVRGEVAIGGGTLPLVGRETNGTIQGVWRNANGQEVPFVAAAGADGLQLQTNGVAYALNRMQMNQGPAPVGGQLQTRQGRVMQCDVPAGWSFSDTTNGVDTSAPDGITWMSHTFLRGSGRCSPDIMIQRASQFWATLGITDVQMVGSKDIAATSKIYEFDYNFRGRPAHCAVQFSVSGGPYGYMAEEVFLQSSREDFQRNLPLLIAMAKSVRVLDNNAFCDNKKLNDLAMERIRIVNDTNREIGDMIINGERARSAIRERSNLGASDTLRDVNRFTDANGHEYTVPFTSVRAFKNADGTISHTSSVTTPVPYGATELKPYNYRGQ